MGLGEQGTYGRLYHACPPTIHGNKIVPLTSLKEINIDSYTEERSKYENRERLLDFVVPILNCLWNDVVFLTPIHPAKFTEAYAHLGHSFPSTRFLAFSIDMIDPARAVVLTYDMYKDMYFNANEVYTPFEPNEISLYSEIPEQTLKYYEWVAERGWPPFQHHLIPHILYKGELSVTGVDIVEV